MALSPEEIRKHFNLADVAATAAEKGSLLEDLVSYVMSEIPGVSVAFRNALNPFGTEELDVVLWNKMLPDGLFFLQSLLLVECKNWSIPVDGAVISYFDARLRHTGCNDGILFSASGITGTPSHITGAHYQIMMSLSNDWRILVVTRQEIESLGSAAQLVELLQRKRLELVLMRTQQL